MKLLFFIPSLQCGGAERVCVTLCNHWAERGWDVTLASYEDGSQAPFFPLSPRVHYVTLGLLRRSTRLVHSVMNNARRVVRLRKFVREQRPERILAFIDQTNVLALIAAWGTGIPVVVAERVDPAHHPIPVPWTILRRLTYGRAFAIAVQTRSIAAYFPDTWQGRVAVIPNPVPELRPRPEDSPGRAGARRSILAMGRLERQKGFDLLIRAFARVAQSRPEWDLTILGEGSERDALASEVARSGFSTRIRLPGRDRDAAAALRRADLFVLSSRYEGFPNALLEAMACGLPVISFDCPSGPADIVTDGVDGRLVPAEDVDALASAMTELTGNEDLRLRLGTAATFVASRYSVESVANRWERVLRDGAQASGEPEWTDVSNIKVTHVITGLTTGGAETMLYRLLKASPSEGSTSEVISLTDIGPVGRKIERLGIKVRALGMTRTVPSPAAFLRLASWLKTSRPDVVQTWMYHADLLGGLAAVWAGRRDVVWNIRIAEVPRQNGLTIAAMRTCAVLSRWLPRRIVCVAEAAKQAHIGYGYDATRMVVIENGLDADEFEAGAADTATLRASLGLTAGDTVIGWVGRFHPDKGQENFVKAAALVAAAQPRAKFLLVGRGCDSGNATLRSWIDGRGLKERFILLGERDDIPVCLSLMDVFCMPSSNEGFPNALAEAMAAGLPSVATTAGDAAIVTGDTAILVRPRDERALARGLLDMLAMSPDERRRLGARAKVRVTEKFSIARTAARYAALYEDVLREAPR